MAVIRLALLALCLWYAVDISEAQPRKPWTPATTCPEECMCSASSLSTNTMHVPLQRPNKQMAQCSSIPKVVLPSSIYSIKVNGEINKLTPALLDKLGKYLEVLDLSDCGITHITKGSFDKLLKLSELKLSNNKIETIDKELFKKNSQLKKLFLDGNLIKEIHAGTFAKCNKLEVLHLEMNHIREFPSKLPPKLTTLDLSYNNIMMLNARDMELTHLKLLNLCHNHIETMALEMFASLRMMDDLCLGMEHVTLPLHTAEKVSKVAHLKLIGELTEQLPVLSEVTQDEIGKMNHLNTLTIENNVIGSLKFLMNHTNLKELHLVNVDVTSLDSIEMKQVFRSNPYLTKINFNRSPKLADLLVNHIYMVANLHDLQQLSMQSANIINLPTSFDAPNANFRLDISHNPLHCDCQFEWLRQMDTESMHYLVESSENTTCHTPANVTGTTLENFVKTVNCTVDSDVEEVTEMFNPLYHDDNTNTDQGDDQISESDNTAQTDENGENQTDQNTEDHKQGEDEQTGETVITAQTDDNGENQTDQNTEDHKQGEDEQTGETVITSQTDENGENQTDQNTEDHKEGEDEQTGETAVETADQAENSQEVDSQGAVHQAENSSEIGTEEKENDDQEQQIQETNNEDGTEMHDDTVTAIDENSEHGNRVGHVHHRRAGHGNDEHAKIYIVLGCVLLVLVLIGVILGVIYWKYKLDGKSKVAPDVTEPPNEPIEPTYKQTLASEDTSLIKK